MIAKSVDELRSSLMAMTEEMSDEGKNYFEMGVVVANMITVAEFSEIVENSSNKDLATNILMRIAEMSLEGMKKAREEAAK